MPQAGLHGLVGMATRKWTAGKSGLLFGTLLGSFIPDMDNVAVAVATLMKTSTEGLHRTATHSVFFIAAVMAAFYVIGAAKKDERVKTLGYGLGLGMLLHSLLDLALWFNGVELFWPLGGEINFWPNGYPWGWFHDFNEQAGEFLFFGLYLWVLGLWARKSGTDSEYLGKQRFWMWLEFALCALFTIALVFGRMFTIVSGALYLVSIFMTFFVTIRMRSTVEAA